MYNFLSCTQTDHWARPWRMYTTSTASRRDCTEAFLSTTSAVSPPRPWPLPPTSSWSRSSTWTSRCFYTAQVCTRACALRVIKQIVLDASFVEWSHWELPFSWIHWRHRGRRLMLKRETGYQTVSEAHHVCFSLSYFLFFLDSPPQTRGFTHDMWLEYVQLLCQCLHGYTEAALHLV